MKPSPETLSQVRRLTIRSRRLVAEQMAGEFRSAFRGAGIEFDEVREYNPGDDVRAIDWNVTARLGRPFIKRFVEERERVIFLLTDVSASMSFGTAGRRKRETAAEVATLLGLSALYSHDRVGCALFTDQLERVLLPRGGNRHVMRVVREVLAYAGSGTHTDLPEVLRRIDRMQRRPAVLFIISDFELNTDPSPLADVLRRLARRHDVVPVWVTDPRERALEPAGVVRVRHPETGDVEWIDTDSARVRQAYAEAFQRWQQSLGQLWKDARMEPVPVGTETSAAEPLISYFEKRKARR